MAHVRFNHMEMTLPPGSLTAGMRRDLAAFYGGVFGWETGDVQIVGGLQFLMQPDDGQFILVAESRRPIQAPGYDHLGLLCASREEVDHLLSECQAWQAKDDRLALKLYDDLETANVVVHAFYVRYLLPLWFDVQVIERRDGTAPPRSWQYI